MNDSTDMNPHDPFDIRYQPTREDVLIGRVTDSEASPADWAELDLIARADAGVWQRLAQAQRAHARFERAVEDEIAIAELVDLPEPPSVVATFRSRWQAWAGWGVAAAVTLAFISARSGMGIGSMPNTASLVHLSPDAALQQYLDAGQKQGSVLRQMPLQVVESQRAESGGQVVMYIRPILERAVVTDLKVLRVGEDENGHQRMVPASVQDIAPPRPL